MKILSAILASAAGFAVAIALTLPATAIAWDVNSLPAGFAVLHTFDAAAVTCRDYYQVAYAPTSTRSGHLCTDSPTFQQDLDAFVDANYTAPVTTTAVPPSPTTSTAATTTAPATTDATTTTDPTTTTAATTTTSTTPTTTTAPADTTTAATTTVTVTTTVVTTTTDTTLADRVSALEQRQAVDEARIAALESRAGLIIGEPKNVAPFTNPIG
jgi:hypothetical protein